MNIPTAIILLLLVIIGIFFFSRMDIENGGIFSQPQNPSTFAPPEGNGSEQKDSVGTKADEVREVVISKGTASFSSDPKEEYIEIRASGSNTTDINITGWQLTNRKGLKTKIPSGTYLPFLSQVNSENDIILSPGDSAYIITGESPISASFLSNACTGYFNQFKEFAIRLPERCPDTLSYPGSEELNDACFSYLKNSNDCIAPLSDIPLAVNDQCRFYIGKNLNYAGCVDEHKNDDDFYNSEWRIYLDRKEEMWSNVRENIKLFDTKGKLISGISY